MYPAGNLFVPVEHGQLEAILKQPAAGPVSGVALVLHPHPLGGGTMHNKVVFRAASALNDAGLTTLRINFRGVGQSTGEYDEGRGELEDVRAGLNYLADRYPEQSITVCGFSFGAWLGLQVGIDDDRVRNLISIGTPLDKYDFSFVMRCRKSVLFVHGSLDKFGDVGKLRGLVEKLESQIQVQLIVVPGADHFFEGHLDKLKRAITRWITAQVSMTNQ
jgi:alpha/beta superfamily hydrolase